VLDIEGAQANWKPRHVRARLDAAPSKAMFDVQDINNVGFKSGRTIDPQAPVYSVNGMLIRDDIKFTKPRPLPNAADHDFFSLKTNDIEGAWPGWTPPHECQPPVERRRHFRNTNFVGDIAGAQPDTVKHAIRTNRVVNPLNPVYDSLDGERLKPPMTPNILNGDPKEFGLAQPDEMPEYRRQVVAMTETEASVAGQGRRGLPAKGGVPAMDLSALAAEFPASDVEKDQMIAQLEEELASLRATSKGTSHVKSVDANDALLQGGGAADSRRSGRREAGAVVVATTRATNGGEAMRRGSRDAARPTPATRRESARLAEDIATVRDL
jgi:hypothetical protein